MTALLGVSSLTGESVALAMPISTQAPPLTLSATPGNEAGTTDVTATSSAITVTSAQVSYVNNEYFIVTLKGNNLPQLTGKTATNSGYDYQNILMAQNNTDYDWGSTAYNSSSFNDGIDGVGISSIGVDTSTELSFTVEESGFSFSPTDSLEISLLPAGETLSPQNVQEAGMGTVVTDNEENWQPDLMNVESSFRYVVGSLPPDGEGVYYGEPASSKILDAPSSGNDLTASVNDYVGVVELNPDNDIIGAQISGPLTSSEVSPNGLSLNVSSDDVATGAPVTVTGSVYTGATSTPNPIADWLVNVNDNSYGSWTGHGSSTVSSVYSVYTNTEGQFSIDWGAPSTSGVYGLTAQGMDSQTQTQYVDVQKVLTHPVTQESIPTTGGTLQAQLPAMSESSSDSTVNVSVPANTFATDTPIFINTVSSNPTIDIPGQQYVAAVGVNFPGNPQAPITLTINNADISVGDSVYQILPDGTYQPITSGVSIADGVATITFSSDPSFVVTQPVPSAPTGTSTPSTATHTNHTSSSSNSSSSSPSATPSTPLTFQTNPYPAAILGSSYDQPFQVEGGSSPYTWSVVDGGLPLGLKLNPSTGVLSGTLSKTGIYPSVIGVKDGVGATSVQSLYFDVMYPYEREIVWNRQITNVPVVVQDGSATPTTDVPIWYVMQLLKATGVHSTWNGHDWNLMTALQANVQHVTAGSGNTNVSLNGVLVQRANAKVAMDPWAHRSTTYLPIGYVEQVLQRLGLQSTWNGMEWRVTPPQH